MEEQCTDGWFQTYSGGRFYPTNPRVQDVRLEDIFHALSNICRFGGHTRRFYSVAQHSELCATWAKLKGHTALICLQTCMHDFTEAYCGDMVRPLKLQLPEYQTIEARIEAVIHEYVGIPLPTDEARVIIKEADNTVLMAERKALFDLVTPKDGWWPNEPEPWPLDLQPIPAELAERNLAWTFTRLYQKAKRHE